MSNTPLVKSHCDKISPWVGLLHRSVRMPNDKVEIFHALELADYISIMPITSDRKLILVRQYRPAIDDYTWEFPGGILDEGENPASGVLRELREETGYISKDPTFFIGKSRPDIGRLNNWLWGYVAHNIILDPSIVVEAGIELRLVCADEIYHMIQDGVFSSGPHLWLFYQSVMMGQYPEYFDALVRINT